MMMSVLARAERSAVANDWVSQPTSRWVMRHLTQHELTAW
jgi:hypothetical protein